MDEPSAQFKPQASWSWGENIPADSSASTGAQPALADGLRSRSHAAAEPEHGIPGGFETESPWPESESQPEPQAQPQQQDQPRQRYYRPRQCRICLEEVPPTLDTPPGGLFGSRPRAKYISEDPALGRLMKPCLCKGSQRYVHEGCLQAWRRTAPLSDRNFWRCPTCGFRYRMSRLRWASWLSNRLTRLVLTLTVVFFVVFLLGFVADPIISFYSDPWGWLFGFWSDMTDEYDDLLGQIDDEEELGWYLHFAKGVLSLSLVGAVQAFMTMNPFTWWRLRAGLYGGGGTQRARQGGGRDRMENINIAFVVIGLFTVMAATWRLVSAMSSRALEKVSEKVMDIQGDDEDEDEDTGDARQEQQQPGP